jgi:isochorismate synthase
MYKDYLAQFAEYQKAFAKGALRKAILSRIKMVGKPDGFEAKALFEKLCQKYPKAFVYLLSHPSFGLWMGASPELLLKKNAAQWQTVSLAGTKPINGHDRPWTSKELEEQEMVSMHVREALKKAGAENLREHGPKTVSAGAVSHLQTIFDFDLGPASVKPLSLLDELHPTPAVAGLPVAAATALIARTEQHPRGLYTGYLGEVGADGTSELYVNLRCMQIGGSQIALYAGGGITAASNPEAEWEETEHKALTLHQELNERV